MQKNGTETLFYTIHTQNSQYELKTNIRSETIKFLGENIGAKPLIIVLGNEFLSMEAKVQSTETKINRQGHIILKNLCIEKETSDRMKKQPWNGRKYLQTTYLIRG